MPPVLFDGLVVPDGEDGLDHLESLGHAVEFVQNQYRHCKPILAIGLGASLLAKAGIPARLPGGDPDPGVIVGTASDAAALLAALARRRHYERETDPPMI